MARRGRCRCGEVLKFKRGPQGYKTRCPNCGAIVRLEKPGPSRAPAVPPPIPAAGAPPQPVVVELKPYAAPPAPSLRDVGLGWLALAVGGGLALVLAGLAGLVWLIGH